jgi:hypothetical protein
VLRLAARMLRSCPGLSCSGNRLRELRLSPLLPLLEGRADREPGIPPEVLEPRSDIARHLDRTAFPADRPADVFGAFGLAVEARSQHYGMRLGI